MTVTSVKKSYASARFATRLVGSAIWTLTHQQRRDEIGGRSQGAIPVYFGGAGSGIQWVALVKECL